MQLKYRHCLPMPSCVRQPLLLCQTYRMLSQTGAPCVGDGDIPNRMHICLSAALGLGPTPVNLAVSSWDLR